MPYDIIHNVGGEDMSMQVIRGPLDKLELEAARQNRARQTIVHPDTMELTEESKRILRKRKWNRKHDS